MQRSDLSDFLHEVEELIEDTLEACHEEVEEMKIDIQGQIQDIFTELKLLRREILYKKKS